MVIWSVKNYELAYINAMKDVISAQRWFTVLKTMKCIVRNNYIWKLEKLHVKLKHKMCVWLTLSKPYVLVRNSFFWIIQYRMFINWLIILASDGSANSLKLPLLCCWMINIMCMGNLISSDRPDWGESWPGHITIIGRGRCGMIHRW